MVSLFPWGAFRLFKGVSLTHETTTVSFKWCDAQGPINLALWTVEEAWVVRGVRQSQDEWIYGSKGDRRTARRKSPFQGKGPTGQ